MLFVSILVGMGLFIFFGMFVILCWSELGILVRSWLIGCVRVDCPLIGCWSRICVWFWWFV